MLASKPGDEFSIFSCKYTANFPYNKRIALPYLTTKQGNRPIPLSLERHELMFLPSVFFFSFRSSTASNRVFRNSCTSFAR